MKRMTFLLVIFSFSLLLWRPLAAQQDDALERALRKLAASLRIKTRMIQIKDPIIYLGFHNSGVVSDSLEKKIEDGFLMKFAGIVVCSVHEDETIKQRFDRYPLTGSTLSAEELRSFLDEPDGYPYILYGIVTKNEKTRKPELKAYIFHQPNSKSYVSVIAHLP